MTIECLTTEETAMLRLLSRRTSDRRRCAALGVTLERAHAIVQSIRGKLGLDAATPLPKL